MAVKEENRERVNPFFELYDTPYETVPFNLIETSDFYDAFIEGIRRDDEEIDKIVNSLDEPTFENTIAAEDLSHGPHYYDLLDRVSIVFSCLLGAETNDELDDLAQKITPVLTKHENDVLLNKELFEKIKYVHDHHRKLTPEEQMLLDTCYDGYVRSGALLDENGKQRLRQLTEEMDYNLLLSVRIY
jgi:peptidyl-dipeptidase Dcp